MDPQIKILLYLNSIRGQNNVNHVLSETLQISEYDVEQAIISLLGKGYIYEDSNQNQKNLEMRAWKIHKNGELKVKEINSKQNQKLKKSNSQVGIIGNTVYGNITGNIVKGNISNSKLKENWFIRFIKKFWWAVVIPLAIGILLIFFEHNWFSSS